MSNTFASLQQVVQDTLQAAPDSLASGTPVIEAPAADSLQPLTNLVEDISQGVSETSQLLASGRWRDVGTNFIDGITELLVGFVPRLLSALVVLIILYLLYRVTKRLLAKVVSRTRFIEAGLAGLLNRTFTVVGWIFIGIMVLAQFDVNISALLAGLSVVGIAVGLAAQDTLQNFIAGITILIDRPFRVGQYIDINGTYGKIEEITLRSTRLRTLNNEMMVMPNSQMINQKLINHSQLGALRVEVPFGIAYKEFPLEARKVVLRLTKGDDRFHPGYTPDVVVTNLNDSSVDMNLRFYIKDSSLEVPIRREYMEKIREALRKADIEIPYPHLQLFIDEAEGLRNIPLLAQGAGKKS